MGHNKLQAWSWTFSDVGSSAEVQAAERRRMTSSFSASGMLEQDDASVWEACQRTLEAGFMRRQFPMNYQQGGMPERVVNSNERPGRVEIAPTETPLLGFYQRWASDMGYEDGAVTQ
jgi:hypothetical protein